MSSSRGLLRIGVDVGGTNTDAVILDLTPSAQTPVLASHKAPTTSDVTLGIQAAIRECLAKADVDKSSIQAVAIGTTSFVNSLVERDVDKLERVAAIRLCGPYSRLTPPFASFPYELRHVLEGPVFFAEGGLQVDGKEISKVDASEIREICAEIRRRGIKAVAVSAVYAPIDHEVKQEEFVRDIILSEVPHVKVSISKEVANIGLLQRENATILNAALLSFAAETVAGFQASAHALDLSCPLFLTSNDGTLMSCSAAEKYPIKTFSSGPTNSMRGASFLAKLASGEPRKETALVIDVGGTSTEIGLLMPTGFPRQAAAHHELCGVSLNFSMPHVHSFGLGGGSRVRKDGSRKTIVGPESVGYRIDRSLSFGGETLTATDIAVAAGLAPGIGDASLVRHLDPADVADALERMKMMIELALDSMKTQSQDIPAYLVGGGAILAPDVLRGVSQVYRFPFSDAANAVGAACAQVSGVIDTFADTSTSTIAEVKKRVEADAIAKAVAAGADAKKTIIVESESIPIAYTTGRCRFYVKAAGEWTGNATHTTEDVDRTIPSAAPKSKGNHTPSASIANANQALDLPQVDIPTTAETILAYRPSIVDREWLLSEVDLEWIAAGCYILGCGGGGSPQHVFLALRQTLRAGHTCRIIDLDSMDPNSVLIWGGEIGSPEVTAERYNDAVVELLQFTQVNNCSALAALEIGGMNGMVNMITGSSKYLNMPTIDGDFMGRAYPTAYQVTPNVIDTGNKGANILPVSLASGDGTVAFMTKAKHYEDIESITCAGAVEMGTGGGCAFRPLSKDICERSMIRNTVSQSWRLGRAVALANKQANVGNVGSVLIDALGGDTAARVLFAGKIVELGRKLHKGQTVGEIMLRPLAEDEEEDEHPDHPRHRFEGIVKIPFQNENLLCEHTIGDEVKVVAGVPDLIAVLDSQSGAALGTQDYKYGLRVLVIGITAAPQWTATPRGMEIGGLPAFGYDLPYRALGKYVQPRSVIEEYS